MRKTIGKTTKISTGTKQTHAKNIRKSTKLNTPSTQWHVFLRTHNPPPGRTFAKSTKYSPTLKCLCLRMRPDLSEMELMPQTIQTMFGSISSTDSVSERLRRWTRNPLGSARRGSNPLAVASSIRSTNKRATNKQAGKHTSKHTASKQSGKQADEQTSKQANTKANAHSDDSRYAWMQTPRPGIEPGSSA